MTLLVRDEEDIIVAHLEHHLNAGVDYVYITDNLSMDRTRELIAPFEEAGRVSVIEERSDDYSQAAWVTRMARMAYADGADWVINSDADEFWWPMQHSNLRSFFESLEPDVGTVVAERTDFPPVEPQTHDPFWERMIYRKIISLNTQGMPLPPKVAHRASPVIEVGQGNHFVSGLDEKLRARDGGLEILHFPIRSESQFTRKIVNGGAAYERNTELPPGNGSTWRQLYAEYRTEGLAGRYRNEAIFASRADDLMSDGSIVRDVRLRDRMRGLNATA